MQTDNEIQQREEALAQAVRFCEGHDDPQRVVTAFTAFYGLLTGTGDDEPQAYVKGDGYVIRWRGIDYVPAATTKATA